MIFYDEGQLVLEGRFTHEIWGLWIRSLAAPAPVAQELRVKLLELIGAFGVTVAKPAHNALLAVGLIFTDNSNYAALAVSALAGTATVGMTYLIGEALFGASVGLVGAFLLAVSPYHLLYSRETLSSAPAVFFWIAALWLLLRSGKVNTFLAGIACGLCSACSYREVYIPAVVIALLAVGMAAKRVRMKETVVLAGLWLIGFAGVLCAFEVQYLVWLKAVSSLGVSYPHGTYFEQLRGLVTLNVGWGLSMKAPWAFGYYLWRWEGVGSLVLFLVALAFALRNLLTGGVLPLLICFGIPWLMFSVYFVSLSRFYVPLIPLVALMEGRLIMAVVRWSGARGKLSLGFCMAVAMVILSLPNTLVTIHRSSPYVAVTDFMNRHSPVGNLSSNPLCTGGMDSSAGTSFAIPASREEVLELYRRGIRFVVVDLNVIFGGYGEDENRRATLEWTMQYSTSVFEAPYTSLALSQYVHEQFIPLASAISLIGKYRGTKPSITVYEMRFPAQVLGRNAGQARMVE